MTLTVSHSVHKTPNLHQPWRVLIVEDQLEISELLSDVLQPLGFQTFVARDGSEATNLVRALKPDVITLDLNLPLKDGRMVLRELAEDPATKHIPVVIISACSGGLTPKGQVVEVLSKPFELADLIGAVMAVVEHRTS